MRANKIVSIALATALIAGNANAAAMCTAYGGAVELTGDQIKALVGTHYVFSLTNSNVDDRWNEYHTGSTRSASGDVDDYKLGPPAKGNVDPCDGGSSCTGTTGSSGTYAINGTTGTGSIQYIYGSSSYTYHIWYGGTASVNGNGSCTTGTSPSCTMGATYAFCNGITFQELMNVNTTHG